MRRSTFFQILATSTGSLISLSDGMQYGWTSPILPLLMSPSTPIPIQESNFAIIENMYMFGAIFGLPLSVCSLNKLGRKRTLFISAIANLLLWIAIGLATNLTTLLLARFVAGLSANINFCALPVYIGEISEKHFRGRLGTIVHVMTLLGTILMYCVGPYISIKSSSTIGGGIILVHLLTFSFMPESPYHLVKTNKDDARQSLQFFRHLVNVEDELNEIYFAVTEECPGRLRLLDFVKVKSYRRLLSIMLVLSIAESFSGITVILMNIHLIFENIPSSLSTNTLAILFSVFMCIGCVFAVFFVDRSGRVSLLVSSGLFTGISLIILSSYLVIKETSDVSRYTWIPVITIIIYAVTYKYGVGLVPLILASELFPVSIKAAGVGISCFTFIVSGIASINAYHYLKSFGLYVPFYVFGSCCLFISCFALLWIPETKGKSLEEIQELLNPNDRIKSDYQEI